MRHKAKFLFRPLLFLVAIAAMGAIVMLLWNAVVPALFAAIPSIDYLHALGLLVLSRILFGGLRGHGGWRGYMHGNRHRHWEKWQAMTPEEREQFRRTQHDHHGRTRGDHQHEHGL